jgi:hypothetical protein
MHLATVLVAATALCSAGHGHLSHLQDLGDRLPLQRIAEPSSRMTVEEAIQVARVALGDAYTRYEAMRVIAIRARASRLAGSAGSLKGPFYEGVLPEPDTAIPAEWQGDGPKLRGAFYDAFVEIMKMDQDADYRSRALLALQCLNVGAGLPPNNELEATMVGCFRRDTALRAHIVRAFGGLSQPSDAARGIVRDALLDPDGHVHNAALLALRQFPSRRLLFSYSELRETLKQGMKQEDFGVRWTAVMALLWYADEAAEFIPILNTLRRTDRNEGVRKAADTAYKIVRKATGR